MRGRGLRPGHDRSHYCNPAPGRGHLPRRHRPIRGGAGRFAAGNSPLPMEEERCQPRSGQPDPAPDRREFGRRRLKHRVRRDGWMQPGDEPGRSADRVRQRGLVRRRRCGIRGPERRKRTARRRCRAAAGHEERRRGLPVLRGVLSGRDGPGDPRKGVRFRVGAQVPLTGGEADGRRVQLGLLLQSLHHLGRRWDGPLPVRRQLATG